MTEAPALTLEQRVAALEELIANPPRMITFPAEWTDEQAEAFEREIEPRLRSGEYKWMPPAPLLTPETAKALLRECVTVVSPGETLVIRVPDGWTPEQVQVYQEYADAATASGRISFPVLVVLGGELAVKRPEPDAPGSPLPGMPGFAAVEVEWHEDGEARREKFGPWLIRGDDSYVNVILGFVNGWCTARGIEPSLVTLTTGDESVAEGAVYPYRDQAAKA